MASATMALGMALDPVAAAPSALEVPRLGTALRLPDLPLLDGTAFQAAGARGQVVVVYWWASWCPFCAQVSPSIQALWQAHRRHGLMVLGLSTDQRPGVAKAHMAKHGYDFPSAWVSAAVEVALPKPRGLPVTVVRGRDGRVVFAEAGQLFPEDIEQFARFL